MGWRVTWRGVACRRDVLDKQKPDTADVRERVVRAARRAAAFSAEKKDASASVSLKRVESRDGVGAAAARGELGKELTGDQVSAASRTGAHRTDCVGFFH